MEDYGTETESDYSSYWRDWVSRSARLLVFVTEPYQCLSTVVLLP
jgi:hypothetical protein